MICLIVRDREISRSYHFYSDVSCNPVEHRKKNSVLKFEDIRTRNRTKR